MSLIYDIGHKNEACFRLAEKTRTESAKLGHGWPGGLSVVDTGHAPKEGDGGGYVASSDIPNPHVHGSSNLAAIHPPPSYTLRYTQFTN